jgi:mono/diheme cytochrome c family protein
VKRRVRFLNFALTVAAVVVLVGLLAACSGTTSSSTSSTTPPAATTAPEPSTPATTPASTPATPAVSGVELGKLIFGTGADNAGPIATKFGIKTITVNACKNCHGANGKGGKGLAGPDIRGSKLQPDFDAAKFARAVTTGIDDAGKPLESKMPRFSATAEDTDALWAYLNSLK